MTLFAQGHRDMSIMALLGLESVTNQLQDNHFYPLDHSSTVIWSVVLVLQEMHTTFLAAQLFLNCFETALVWQNAFVALWLNVTCTFFISLLSHHLFQQKKKFLIFLSDKSRFHETQYAPSCYFYFSQEDLMNLFGLQILKKI